MLWPSVLVVITCIHYIHIAHNAAIVSQPYANALQKQISTLNIPPKVYTDSKSKWQAHRTQERSRGQRNDWPVPSHGLVTEWSRDISIRDSQWTHLQLSTIHVIGITLSWTLHLHTSSSRWWRLWFIFHQDQVFSWFITSASTRSLLWRMKCHHTQQKIMMSESWQCLECNDCWNNLLTKHPHSTPWWKSQYKFITASFCHSTNFTAHCNYRDEDLESGQGWKS